MKSKGIGIGIVIGLVIGSVIVGGYVAARPAATTKTLAACVDSDGTMHLKVPATSACKKGQKKVTWNVKGPRGPQGLPGADGADGADGDKGDTGDAVLESVNCLSGQTIVWTGTDWGCRTIAITGQLSITSATPLLCCTTLTVFDSYTPNVMNLMCDFVICDVTLADVSDHQSCTVTVYGNPNASAIDVLQTQWSVSLRNLEELTAGEPLYVNLSCLQ